MGLEFKRLVREWETVPRLDAIWRYGIALAAVFAATSVRLAFNPVLGVEAPHVPLVLGVIVAAWFGGRGPGLAATALSTLALDWLFLKPLYSLTIANREEFWVLALFAVTGVLIALLVGRLRELLMLRARAAEALRASQARLEFVLQAANLGAWDLDLTSRKAWRSPQHDAIFGYPAGLSEWTYEMFLDHVLPEDRPEIDSKVRQALLRDADYDAEFRIRRADGEVRWIWALGRSQPDQEGRPLRLTGIVRDITVRKTLEEGLRQSEDQFRTLANTIPQLCGMAKPDGWFFWVNQRWQDYTGLAPEQSVGWGWLAALDPEASREALEIWRHSITAGEPFESEFSIRGADGIFRPFLARAMPVRDRDGKVARWFATLTDISQQRKTEDALRKAHNVEVSRANELEAIMDAVPVAMFVSRDPECLKIIGNRSAYQLFREPPGSNLSKSAPEGEKPAARLMKGGSEIPSRELPLQKAAATGQPVYDVEVELAFEDGSLANIIGNAVPFLDAEGHSRGSVGVFVDITERKRSEERLRQAQKLESIGLLAGGIAHDFNNLLTVIIGNADCVLHKHPSIEEIQHIISASERAAELTRQLLAYAGQGQFVVARFNLNDLVSRCTQLLSASVPKRVELMFGLAEHELFVEADPSQIEQILMNLVINAGEAIPPHRDGRIEIVTRTCDVPPEVVRSHAPAFDAQAGQFVCLEVTDNGSGMDEATLPQIFDPFYSTKFTGRGLGLAALQGIVRSCRGFVEVRSSIGAGSTFRVFLPAARKKPAVEIPAGAGSFFSQRRNRKPAVILVVDDEEMVRKLACTALRSRGYEVLEATNGKDALEVLARTAPRPSLVLLDLTMPAMGGEELVAVLSHDYPGLPIIVTSGYPEEYAQKGFSPGLVAGFLQKPYTVATLTERVEGALDSRGPNEEAPAAA